MLKSEMSPIVWVNIAICLSVISINVTFLWTFISDRKISLQDVESYNPNATNASIANSTDWGRMYMAATQDATIEEEDRPLILYAYHETENARQNALFFVKHGLHAQADFIFIMNGETSLGLSIPSAPNIKIIQRNNTCFDLGSHAEVLNSNNGELVEKYKRFILMNASIRGPFLPTWSRECWSDAYLGKVTDTNKLVGMTVNCIQPHHIQSMIFATDRIGVRILLPLISRCFTDILDAVSVEKEATNAIINAGYNATAMMSAFAGSKNFIETCDNNDLLFDGAYFGTNIHPYEMIFQKANRNIAPKQLELLTEWHENSGYSSWDVCFKAKKRRDAVRRMKSIGFNVEEI
ncbi:hypothetical protein H072_6671 [Dactylellina haptotyla CBS 200.50]|uniref:Uncharacterized protein n=1 Tax=Dactylellina haptotyla (strain CBS 200.50) TaxID=1284197 RepID=S8AEF6_DACHA|nr:hypothetical protein H072_6671 [Dactylellina haptotyla CBS 200.50]